MQFKILSRGLSLILLFLYAEVAYNQSFVAGESYVISNKYVEYIHGNLPLVISVPHGGYEKPDDIPERIGRFAKNQDIYTIEIVEEIKNKVYELTGMYPYIVINHLHRTRLDANRALREAANGNKDAEEVWFTYHEQLDSAKALIVREYGKGLFIDLHGHRHNLERIELGYLISDAELRLDFELLKEGFVSEFSSMKSLLESKELQLSFTDLIMGDFSFGTLLSSKGQECVPDNKRLYPEENEPYFSGGYNTMRHGSSSGGTIDAIQIEIDLATRTNAVKQVKISHDIALSLMEYLSLHYFPEHEVLASFGKDVIMVGE